jgi:hypothetical protein
MTREIGGTEGESPPSSNGGEEVALRRWRRAWFCLFGLVMLVGTVALVMSFAKNHRRLVIALIAFDGTMGLGSLIGWLLLSRDEPTRRLMRHDWRTQRRVAKTLRNGQRIPVDDREAARDTIEYHKSRRFTPWLYVLFALTFLLDAARDHGVHRWIDLSLVVIYVVLAPVWFRTHRRIVRRDDDLDGHPSK